MLLCLIGRTSRFIKMRQVRKVITGFKYSRVHEWRQSRVVVILEGRKGCVDFLGLQKVSTQLVYTFIKLVALQCSRVELFGVMGMPRLACCLPLHCRAGIPT